MSPLADELARLDSAEAFMEHLGIVYEARTLNVNRLHILKRFNQYLARAGGIDALEPACARERCREMLTAAYADFTASTGVEQKVFPIFHRVRGEQHVSLARVSRREK